MANLDGPTTDAPYGYLPNGHARGDLSQVPRCGAKRRRRAELCQAPAMANGRCRIHGGVSTGPKTDAGRERCRMANWKHGRCTDAKRAESRQAMAEVRQAIRTLDTFAGKVRPDARKLLAAEPSQSANHPEPARQIPEDSQTVRQDSGQAVDVAPTSSPVEAVTADPEPTPVVEVEQDQSGRWTADKLARMSPEVMDEKLGLEMAAIFYRGRAGLKSMGCNQRRADELLLDWIYRSGDAEAVLDLVEQAAVADVSDPVGAIEQTIAGHRWG